MMRKTSVILLSAATGAALTLLVTQPRAVFMGSSARAAGVSSIGETTLTRPFSIVTSMPSPPNSPRVCTCMSLKFFSLR